MIVLIGGGHAAGKRSTALLLEAEAKKHDPCAEIELIDMSKYEKHEDRAKASRDDTPAALKVHKGGMKYVSAKPSRFDFEKLRKDLSTSANKIFVVHGLYALYDKELRDMAHIKIFIDSDPDTRLIRWIRRDVMPEKGEPSASLEDVILEYLQGARSEMNDYIFPTKEFADVIMPRGAEANAVGLIFDGLLLNGTNKLQAMMRRDSVNEYLRPLPNGKSIFYELN